MNEYYPHLFEPLRIKNHVFRNRIISTPNGTRMYDSNGRPLENCIKYYEGKARGGAAQVTIGQTMPNRNYMTDGYAWNGDIRSPECQPMWAELANAIKCHGAIASIQLNHPGLECDPRIMNGRHALGPVATHGEKGIICDAMTEKQIYEAIDDFVQAALAAQKAGFDGVQLHCAHGWLPAQFLSTRINTRQDGWGGSFENRSRFIREMSTAVRKAAGPNFLLEMRLSDEINPKGMPFEEVIEVAEMVSDTVDLLHISAGLHEFPETLHAMFPHCIYTKPGCNVPLAEKVKQRVHIPVITVGGINSPELAEKILAEGKADFIGMGRQLIADAEFPDKARAGKAEEIRPCIRCSECLLELGASSFFTCTVNPQVNHDFRWEHIPKAEIARKVVIIGGGPGGMEAAVTARKQGHQVILFEREASLGGQMRYTDYDDAKYDLKRYKDYMAAKTMESADVRLNTQATAEMVRAEQPDAVIVAVGAESARLPIPGADGDNVVAAIDAYYHPELVGKKAVVIGGGILGVEHAMYLARKGRHVVVLEQRNALGDPTNERHTYPMTLKFNEMTTDYPLSAKTGVKVMEIGKNFVSYLDAKGKEERVDCETVVIAVGMKPNFDAAEAFRYCAPYVRMVGDCSGTGKIKHATRAGFHAAMDIK